MDESYVNEARYLSPTTTTRPIVSSATSFRSLRPYLRKKLSRRQINGIRTGPELPTDRRDSTGRRNVTTKGEGDRIRNVLRRARSTTWSGSSLPTAKSTRVKAVRPSSREPPPFAEAFRHAILHARLEVAVPTRELRRNGILLSRYSPASTATSPSLSRKNRSSSQSTVLAPKVVILSEDGCILQYDAGGASNRTPEQILELGANSIAIASDEIPGRHWVLNVVCNSCRTNLGLENLLKSERPGLSLRSRSNRQMQAPSLLLAFEDDQTFNKWLVTVRTEIEDLGGLEYDPDSTMSVSTPVTVTDELFPSPIFPSAPFVRPFDPPRQSPLAASQSTNTGFSAHSTARSSVYTQDSPPQQRNAVAHDRRSLESGSRTSFAGSDQDRSKTSLDARFDKVTSPSKRARRPDLTPIIIEPTNHDADPSSSLSADPSMPRTPTLTLDTMHSMAGAFEKPATPSTPSFSPSLAPFAFTQLLVRSATAGSLSVNTGCLEPNVNNPPPPYTLAPQRRSSQKTIGESRPPNLAGLGIIGSEPGSAASASISPSSDIPSVDHASDFGHAAACRGSRDRDTDGSIWAPPAAPVRRIEAASRDISKEEIGQQSLKHEHSIYDRPADENTTSLASQSRCSAPDQSSSHRSGPALRQQRSMPSLPAGHRSDIAPAVPPPSRPLPAVPPAPTPGTQMAQWPLPSSVGVERPTLRHRAQSAIARNNRVTLSRLVVDNKSEREWDRDRVSPLSSNPMSPAEVKFARRLSIVSGIPVISPGISPLFR